MREYQVNIIASILNYYINNEQPKPTVLAASCSAGKTIMSICIADIMLQRNPDFKILVLTHGQDILRTQYYEDIVKYMLGDEYKDENGRYIYQVINAGEGIVNTNKNIIVTLPQTINNHIDALPHFDMLIVDEAHDRYTTKREENLNEQGQITTIINKIQPSYQLLLTGTPFKFNNNEQFNVVHLAINQLPEDDICDIRVELATSTYRVTKDDYNGEGHLIRETVLKQTDTIKSLNALLDEINKRLKIPDVMRNNYTPDVAETLVSKIFTKLKKTLVVCQSVKQGQDVEKYFIERTGADSVTLSVAKDVGSKNIKYFKENKACKVLVVVRKANIGFNYPALRNIVDLSMSFNPERVFQMYGRLLRRYPTERTQRQVDKYYYKIAPNEGGFEDYLQYFMTGILCLTDERFYKLFNGNNFMRMKIPVVNPKTNLRGETNEINTIEKDKNNTIRRLKTPAINFKGMESIKMFKSILHRGDDIYSPYAYITLKEVRDRIILNKDSIDDILNRVDDFIKEYQ